MPANAIANPLNPHQEHLLETLASRINSLESYNDTRKLQKLKIKNRNQRCVGSHILKHLHSFLAFLLPSFLSSNQMDFYERRKKSDKAKDKAGQPSSKHVRAYEALLEKKQHTKQPIPKLDPKPKK